MRTKPLINPLRVSLLPVLVLAVLAVNGCIFGPGPPEGDEPPPGLDTPAGVVEYIEDAYNTRDIDAYKECLSPNFTFYFDPNDVGQDVEGFEIPASWGYDDEVSAVANMFYELYDINLSIASSPITGINPSEPEFEAFNIKINLLVMVDATNGYRAEGPVDFTFESYYTEKGEKLWRVKDWWDRTWSG